MLEEILLYYIRGQYSSIITAYLNCENPFLQEKPWKEQFKSNVIPSNLIVAADSVSTDDKNH